MENVSGVELVWNVRRGVAVIATSGDGATGNPGYVPQVRYDRQEVTQKLVDGWFDTLWGSLEERPHWCVYFLLHALNKEGSVPAELSKPKTLSRAGWVEGWDQRIIIPETTDADEGRRAVAPIEPSIELDIAVVRRAG